MEKLTPTQSKILAKMEKGTSYSAYGLQASLATLDALSRKKYVKRDSSMVGCIAFPHSSIKYTRIV